MYVSSWYVVGLSFGATLAEPCFASYNSSRASFSSVFFAVLLDGSIEEGVLLITARDAEEGAEVAGLFAVVRWPLCAAGAGAVFVLDELIAASEGVVLAVVVCDEELVVDFEVLDEVVDGASLGSSRVSFCSTCFDGAGHSDVEYGD